MNDRLVLLLFSIIVTLLSSCGKQSQPKQDRYFAKAHHFYLSMHYKYREEIEFSLLHQKNDLIDCIADKHKKVRWHTYLFGNPELSRNMPLHKGHRRISRDIDKLNGQLRKVKCLADPRATHIKQQLEALKAELTYIKITIQRHQEFRQEDKFASSYVAMEKIDQETSSLRKDLLNREKNEEIKEEELSTNKQKSFDLTL